MVVGGGRGGTGLRCGKGEQGAGIMACHGGGWNHAMPWCVYGIMACHGGGWNHAMPWCVFGIMPCHGGAGIMACNEVRV